MATCVLVGLIASAAIANVAGAAESATTSATLVQVMAGGVGESEENALLAREKEFNLKLVFSLVEGNYLADVDVVVTDARGKTLFERRGEGPLVLARLPAGDYGIAATHAGRTIVRKLKLSGSRPRSEYFRWPADPAHDVPVSRWLER